LEGDCIAGEVLQAAFVAPDSFAFRRWRVNWLALLGILPPVLFKLLSGRLAFERPLARFNLWCGPALPGLIWLHGVLFDPPNNWAVLRDGALTSLASDGTVLTSTPAMGFFEFWFHPFRSMDWTPEKIRIALWLSLPALGWLLAWFLYARRTARTADPDRRAPHHVTNGQAGGQMSKLSELSFPDGVISRLEAVGWHVDYFDNTDLPWWRQWNGQVKKGAQSALITLMTFTVPELAEPDAPAPGEVAVRDGPHCLKIVATAPDRSAELVNRFLAFASGWEGHLKTLKA
jgi:hypothetical protein